MSFVVAHNFEHVLKGNILGTNRKEKKNVQIWGNVSKKYELPWLSVNEGGKKVVTKTVVFRHLGALRSCEQDVQTFFFHTW